eukprot:TRINITY_DN12041_c0_g2_i3.p1 TRINITY_DN12041_c0_g2~~TRINITY_DN12041_c0_g2_i3.p1  ORF type:complete len:1247 (+),score=448.76 TRINITY_DN12041_c0_g2_i3:60-3800(+)
MFGGMQVKDDSDTKSEEQPSSFSFINSAPAAQPEEGNASTTASAFSFIGGGDAPAPATEAAVERIAPAPVSPLVAMSAARKKKKKSSKLVRPGHARFETSEAPEPQPSSSKSEPSSIDMPKVTTPEKLVAAAKGPDESAKEHVEPARGTPEPVETEAATETKTPVASKTSTPSPKAESGSIPAKKPAASPSTAAAARSNRQSTSSSGSTSSDRAPKRRDNAAKPVRSKPDLAQSSSKDREPSAAPADATKASTANSGGGFFGRLWGKKPSQKSPAAVRKTPANSDPQPMRTSPKSAKNRSTVQPVRDVKPARGPRTPEGKQSQPKRRQEPQTEPTETAKAADEAEVSTGADDVAQPEQSSEDKTSEAAESTTGVANADNTDNADNADGDESTTRAAASEEMPDDANDVVDRSETNETSESVQETEDHLAAEPAMELDLTQSDASVTARALNKMEEAKAQHEKHAEAIEALAQAKAKYLAEQAERQSNTASQQQQLQDFEAELEEAIESEDYDKAAQLESDIAALRDEVSQPTDCVALRKDVHKALNALLSEEEELVLAQAECHRETSQFLESSLQEQLDELKTFRAELEDATRTERSRIDADNIKLQRVKRHLQVDQQHLDEAESRLESLASERTSEFQKSKRKLEGERERVRKTIQDLQRQLREAQAQEERLDQAIAKENDRITAAQQDLVVEREAVDQQRQAVREQEESITEQEAAIAQAQAELDNSTASARQQVEALDEAANEVKLHIVQARLTLGKLEKQLGRFLLDDVSEERQALNEMGVLTKAVQTYQSAAQGKTGKLNELDEDIRQATSTVLELQQELKSARKQAADIDEQLPQLVEAKKLAVGSRNFKEASRLNAEISALKEQEEASADRVRQTEEELGQANAKLEALQKEVESERTDLSKWQRQQNEDLLVKLARMQGQLFKCHRRAVRRKQPAAMLLQADLDLCRGLLAQVTGVLEQAMPELPSDPETDEDVHSDDDEPTTDDLGVIAGSLIDFGDDDGDENTGNEATSDGLVSDIAMDLLSTEGSPKPLHGDLEGLALDEANEENVGVVDDETADNADNAGSDAVHHDANETDAAIRSENGDVGPDGELETGEDREAEADHKDVDDNHNGDKPSLDDDEQQESPSEAEPVNASADEYIDVEGDADGDAASPADATEDTDVDTDRQAVPSNDGEEPIVVEEATSESEMERQRIQAAVSELELKIEAAIIEEDYDLCEALDEELAPLKEQLAELEKS